MTLIFAVKNKDSVGISHGQWSGGHHGGGVGGFCETANVPLLDLGGSYMQVLNLENQALHL